MKRITAAELEVKGLAILDDVAETGEVVTILKHGRAVAQLVPTGSLLAGFPQDGLAGTVEFLGEVVAPVGAIAWDPEVGDR